MKNINIEILQVIPIKVVFVHQSYLFIFCSSGPWNPDHEKEFRNHLQQEVSEFFGDDK